MYIAAFIIELAGLFFLSRKVTDSIYLVSYLLTRSRTFGIWVLTILLFPGTVTHELAHLFSAGILGVPAGKLTLIPESFRGENITMGSVSIAHTDPFRRYMIGLAPIGSGTVILTTLAYFFNPLILKIYDSVRTGGPVDSVNLIITLGIFYLLFSVSNAMFSSPEDVKGLTWFILVLGLIAVTIILISGISVNLNNITVPPVIDRLFMLLSQAVGLVMAVNIFILAFFSLLSAIIQKILRVRVG
jgi:hypothetical protein